MEKLLEEQSGDAAVEIQERMDRQEPPLRKGQGFQQQIVRLFSQGRQPHLEVRGEIAHQHRHLMRRRRTVDADAHLGSSPAARPLGNQVTGDLGMEEAQEVRVQSLVGEAIRENQALDPQHSLRQQRGELRVAQDSARGFEITGGANWFA